MLQESKSILFVGDSLTEWFDLDYYFPQSPIVNEGIAGDTTYGLLERIDDIISVPAKRIFLMIGINDILNGFDKDDIIENLQLLIENIGSQSSKSKLIIQSILPVNETMLGAAGRFNHIISDINASLKEYCEDCRHIYLDLYAFFLNGSELNSIYTTDGAHLSRKGYQLWAEKIKALLV
jgi:lysophospholipase L1-like esterase